MVLVKELKAEIGNYKKGDLVIDMAPSQTRYNHILQGPNVICPAVRKSCWSHSQI